eukprot:CAMPEP_0175200904 /NCGR_PEP_ID=MMETSP0093-20121207/9772_1 /TAXON_ID=311494 /ORGANISM="Alexandrium monilatum, Strain CCMP3105" /LENGTH=246 /DNA_ID=CAMNT_0016493921 /DNA_START=60 /DNA_END=796 /DNA_ORIENTATION=-
MARSNGRTAAAALLGAVGYLLLSQLAAFVNPAQNPGRQLRSRVSLAATQADVDAAKKAFELQKWAASHLAGEGSPQAAAAATRAQQAEAVAAAAILSAVGYLLLSQLVAFTNPVQTPNRQLRSRVSLAATQADVDAAKKTFELQKWAASHLAGEGSPQAAAAATRAQQAEAAYMALKAQLEGQAPPAAPAMPVAVAPAPVAAAPAPAVAAVATVSKADLAAAKQNAQLLTWAASKLLSEGHPQAAA